MDNEILEQKFVDYFQMTVDQFDQLDLETQQQLVSKALILRKKTKKLEERLKTKYKLGDILSQFLNNDVKKK